MLDALLEFTTTGHLAGVFTSNAGPPVPPTTDLPTKMENSNLHKHSKVKILVSVNNFSLRLELSKESILIYDIEIHNYIQG